MHPRFIFLSLLHKAIANQELPLFRTNNLFPPALDLLAVTAAVSAASTSAASASASQVVETRGGNGKYVDHQKRQDAPFPIEPVHRPIFNDGALDSAPKNGFLESRPVSLLPKAGRGNALEIDEMGVVRIRKQFGLSVLVDDAGSALPEPIGPDDRDPARTARPEERRSMGRKCDHHVHYPGVNRRRDLYHGNHLPPADPCEDSNRVGCAAVETKDEHPMPRSNNQMSPRPTYIFSGEGESLNQRPTSPAPPYLDENRFRSLGPLDRENISEDVDIPRMEKGEDGGGHNSDTNSRNECSLLMNDSVFGPAAKGSTRPVISRAESETKEGPNQKGPFHESHFRRLYPTFPTNIQFRPPHAEPECLRENAPSLPIDFGVRGGETAPTFGLPRTSDLSLVPLLPRGVIRGVSSAETAPVEVYKLQRGGDGAMRSVLVKRLDANLGIQQGLGRPIRHVELSHDGKVYVVGAAVEIHPVDPITILEESSLISRELRPAKPVGTLDESEPGPVDSPDPHSDLEPSDGRQAESVRSFRPFEFGGGGGSHPNELGRGHNERLATLGETGGRPLARRPHSLGGGSQVSLSTNLGTIYVIELGDDGGMNYRTVKRRSNEKAGSTADFQPILPDPLLGAASPVGKDAGTLTPNAGARSGGNRVSISSPLMADQNGRVYYKTTQAHLGDGAHAPDLPGLVPPTRIQLVSMDEIGQLLSKDLENRESNCLLNTGSRTASGSVLAPAGCVVQARADGKSRLRGPKRSIDGSDYTLPFVEGNPIQPFPDSAQAANGNEEARVGAGGGAGASDKTNMTPVFHSMTLDKLAVVLPVVMFGTLLLVLVVFGMTFCCLRQAEEIYHINIKAVENKKRRNRDSRRRRRNSASTGAAEEGDITVPPGAFAGQPEVGGTSRGWFLQRWRDSLRGGAPPKTVSFSSPEAISQRNLKSNLGCVRGLDGVQDTRDPSYILDAVSDRLHQVRGCPRSLSTVWSDGGPEGSAAAGALLATGRIRSEDASPNTTMVSRRMHGAKGDTTTGFHQESVSTTETTGVSGNRSSDSTLAHSLVGGFTDTSGPGRQEELRSEGTFRVVVGSGLGVPPNLGEPKEFVRIIRPDLDRSGPGAEDTSGSSETGENSGTEGSGAAPRRREGDTRGREHEAGPSETVGDQV